MNVNLLYFLISQNISGNSKITLCLIQREVISKIKGFGLQFHPFERRFLMKYFVVFSSFDVHGYYLT